MTIASIVKLQMRMTVDKTVERTLKSVLNRVEALSTVQRKLLGDETLGHFDVADFARDLVTDIVGSLRRSDIILTTDLSPVIVPASEASPLAIILNELIGDAVRRGLGDGGGEIHLEIRKLNGHFLIRVADTVTPSVVNKEEEAFSNAMLDASLRQMKAELKRRVEGHRTEVCVTIPVAD